MCSASLPQNACTDQTPCTSKEQFMCQKSSFLDGHWMLSVQTFAETMFLSILPVWKLLAEKLTLSGFSAYAQEFIRVCKFLHCAQFAECSAGNEKSPTEIKNIL